MSMELILIVVLVVFLLGAAVGTGDGDALNATCFGMRWASGLSEGAVTTVLKKIAEAGARSQCSGEAHSSRFPRGELR